VFLPKHFGAKENGISDDTAALQACIDAAGGSTSYAGSKAAGGQVLLSQAIYRLTKPLHIRRSIRLEGVHGNGWFGGTVLQWDKDTCIDTNDDGSVGGIVIDNYLSGPASPGGVAGMRGDWSVITNLVLSQVPGGNPFNICNGIAQIANVNLDNVLITDFQGDGLRACTNASFLPNLDGSEYNRLFIQNCGRHGIFMKGTDAQVCQFGMVVVESNGVWGVREESFFGNNYVTTLTESNGYFNNAGTWAHGGNPVGATVRWSTSKSVLAGDVIMPIEAHATGYQYKCVNAGTCGASEPTWPLVIGGTVTNGNVVIKCFDEEGGSVRVPQVAANASTFGYLYTESDQNGPWLPGCSVLGGLWSPDASSLNLPAFGVHEGVILPLQNVITPGSIPLRTYIGYPARQAVLSFQRQAESSDFSLQWDDTGKRWRMIWAGLTGYTSLCLTGPDASVGPNRLQLPDGFIAGRDANARQVRWFAAKPSATSTDLPNRLWLQGDIVWNTAPTAGGIPGWVSTTAGGWGGGREYSNRTWTTSLPVYAGDGIEPSTPNTFVYICTSTGAAFGGFAFTSGAEPTWPLTPGASVTGADGITWKNFGQVGAVFGNMAVLT
jgi:hypothetical protein